MTGPDGSPLPVSQDIGKYYDLYSFRRDMATRNLDGWRAVQITSTGGTNGAIIVLWERGAPTLPISVTALAYLAGSPDPDVAAEATALITAALQR